MTSHMSSDLNRKGSLFRSGVFFCSEFNIHTLFCFSQVREILGRCSCPAQFPMIKVSEGKYKVGDSSALIFIRVSLYYQEQQNCH